MQAEEIAQLVEELDSRLERLRVLYDQYFMGIEKIPPGIVQKDVDRRIFVLRREKIRNTGIRFRFQQIVQKYNTFGSYWMRICRDIENGTYKRDVIRANKRFGKAAAAKQAPVAKVAESEPPPSFDLELDVDVEVEVEMAAAPAFRPGSFDTSDLDSLDDDRTYKGPAPQLPVETAPPRPLSAVPLPPAAVATVPPKKPLTPLSPLGRPLAPPAQKPPPVVQSRPPAVAPPPAPLPKPPPSAPVRSPTPAPPVAHQSDPAIAKKIAARTVKSNDDLDDMLSEALGPTANDKPIPAAPTAKPKPAEPRPSVPVQAKPAAPVQAKPAAAKPANGPSPGAGDDYRQVYAQLIESRRKNGESTAGLTYDSLAKNLRETTEKLKARSGGKSIGFDVVMKDGKTILKPVVK